MGDLKDEIVLCGTRDSTFFLGGILLDHLDLGDFVLKTTYHSHVLGSKSWQVLCWYMFGARIVNSTFAYTTWYHSF